MQCVSTVGMVDLFTPVYIPSSWEEIFFAKVRSFVLSFVHPSIHPLIHSLVPCSSNVQHRIVQDSHIKILVESLDPNHDPVSNIKIILL